MSNPCIAVLLVISGLLAACTVGSGDTSILSTGNGNSYTSRITLHDGQITLHVKGAPNAVIDAAGDLTIDRQPITVNPAQRTLLQAYYRGAMAVRSHGIATGKAGVAVAGQAIASVARGLASGDTDNIDKEVDAKAARVEQEAQKICLDVVGVKSAQDALATQVPAFKPYAGIVDADAVDECSKQVTR